MCVCGGDQRVVYAKLHSTYSYSIYFGLCSELELTASKENGHNSGCCLAFLSFFLRPRMSSCFNLTSFCDFLIAVLARVLSLPTQLSELYLSF